jgi:hypothetical protein
MEEEKNEMQNEQKNKMHFWGWRSNRAFDTSGIVDLENCRQALTGIIPSWRLSTRSPMISIGLLASAGR